MLFISKNSWFQLMRTLRWCLSANVFKAGGKLVSLSHMAFPRLLFTSRRLRYLLRMCGAWLKPCSGKSVVENASNYSFTFPQVLEITYCTFQSRIDHPCEWIIARAPSSLCMSIRRFLVVESHSLMIASSDVVETVTSATWLKFRDETETLS